VDPRPLKPGRLEQEPAPAESRPSAVRARAAWASVAAVLGACAAGPAVRPPEPIPKVAAAATVPAVTQPPIRLDTAEAAPGAAADDLGPDILRPAPESSDAEVARVGARVVSKRHLYDRLLETNPQQARELVDSIVLDLLIADLAETYGVVVTAADLDPRLAEEEKQLRERLAAEFDHMDYDRYLMQQFGMDGAEYARWRRLTLARTLYRQYVIRYHAMQGERVQVRYIVTSDRALLEEVRKQVQDGASFGRLALRHSQDESRKDGGLLPPFGPGLDHPITDVALRLAAGDLSEVIEREVGGQKRFYLVSCLRRLPADVRPFAAVRADIDEDIKARPLTRFDFHCFYFETRGRAETPRNPLDGR